MATTQTLLLTHFFNSELNPIYNSILDFQRFGEMHPLMNSVKIIEDKSPEFIEYTVEEKLLVLGIVVIKPCYQAKVYELKKQEQVRYTSQVKTNIFLVIDFTFSKEGATVTVKENIAVTGNKLITTVFLRILKKAHLATFEHLKMAIASPKAV